METVIKIWRPGHRRVIPAFVTALALVILGWGMPSMANAATVGVHNDTFRCEVSGAPGEYATLEIGYTITDLVGDPNPNTRYIKFNEAIWETSPARLLNALRLDLENDPDDYYEISPPWGNSSTSPDDVSSSFHQTPATTASWPDITWAFENRSSPALRLRAYGMGPGQTPNDAAHNCVIYHDIE